MGDLRNALAKNDLKLPDLSGPGELIAGDRLLRADRELATVLDGVYRPAEIYLRWPQRLSSLAFGTRPGRFVTQYVALPYGGAYLILEGLRHLLLAVTGHATHDLSQHSVAASIAAIETAPKPPAVTWGPYWVALAVLGTWLALLIHRPPFRTWCVARLRDAWQLARQVLVVLPTRLLHSPLVQRILRSPVYTAIRNYFVRPAILTLLMFMVCRLLRWAWSAHITLDVLLVTTLLLNSPAGRYADEWITDSLARDWHDLRIKVLTAAYHWIMDLFHRLAVSLERVVYTVDEWLRFRTGDDRQVEAVKLLAGTCWFFVAYVVVFAFTLLIEPQINPIKHFPVVTVSHKLILPTGPVFVEQLEPYIGKAKATTLVWSTIWLIPGVFGFLVWELKGNWRLYAANRPRTLLPVPVGRHGETLTSLLRPGFHSGTLPKLYGACGAARAKHNGPAIGNRSIASDWNCSACRKRSAVSCSGN